MLSGWYWFGETKKIDTHYHVANVYDAFLTHAYIINRAAAALLIEPRPFITADDWFYIRKKGVKICALLPHLIDQDWSGTNPTSINEVKRVTCKGMWKRKFQIRLHSLYLKVLKLVNHFEKA